MRTERTGLDFVEWCEEKAYGEVFEEPDNE